MGITAKARSTVRITGTTQLSPEQVLEIVREGASTTKGGGASLLTTGIWNIGAQIVVARADDSSLTMALTSGRNLVELCTFSARVNREATGRTGVLVGGLETYKTQQQKLYYVIPVGPKQIPGMSPYKRFLDSVHRRILESDPTADVQIAQAD